jgi:hypothetical protein
MIAYLLGTPEALPAGMVRDYPELERLRFRRGGIPPRVAGWLLGRSTVAAVTLWRTIWLGKSTAVEAELLLHESRHVAQFESGPAFPFMYAWESLRRGYHANRFEVDARAYAARRARGVQESNPARK